MTPEEDVYGYVILNPYDHGKVPTGTKFNRALSEEGHVVFFSMQSSHPPAAAARAYSHTKLISLGQMTNIDYGIPMVWSHSAPQELRDFLAGHGVLPCDEETLK